MMNMKYLALVIMIVGLSGCSSTLAFLDEDENGQTFEQRTIQDGLVTVGVLPRKQEDIEYKERKGLAIPKSMTALPQPVESKEPKKQAWRNRNMQPVQNPSVAQPEGVVTYDQIQQGREAGAQLVKNVPEGRNRSANPGDLDYNDWRAYEDKQAQGQMARGAPVQSSNDVSALDWNIQQKNGAAANTVDYNALKAADKSPKTKFDPPAAYKVPAPMNNLSQDEIQRVENMQKRNGWWPF